MSKFKKLYDILHCDIEISINDLDAWIKHEKYNWVYNRLKIAKFQNIKCAPMPIEPDKNDFPIIIKPIINLYGMGLNVKKVKNLDEFYDHWNKNGFWMEYLNGDHLSWDLVLYNGKIEYYVCFKGHKDHKRLGRFWYWESFNKDEYKLPSIIKKLVKQYFIDYYGCINIETIGSKIIECHLRMGDIDLFPTYDILKGIISAYKKEIYDWSKIITEKIYFIPFWGKDNTPKEVFNYIKDKVLPKFEKISKIHEYELDEMSSGHPSDYRRLFWISCSDLDYGKSILRKIKLELQSKFNFYFSVI